MREIKFRAWDKQKNVLGTVIELSYSPIVDLGYVPSYVRVQNLKDFGEVIHYSNHDEIKDCLVIEQYTGLKDVNGVEIYEGDVVKMFSNINKYTRDFANDIEPEYKSTSIAYDNGAFRIVYKGKPDTILNNNGSTFVKYIEVISNIHEQPEMLEDK